MKILTNTPSRLVVTHHEPATRIVTVLAILSFIVCAAIYAARTQMEAGSDLITGILVIVLLIMIAGGFYASRISETYTFDKEQRSFTFTNVSPLGQRQRNGKLDQIVDVFQASDPDTDSMKEFVILVIEPNERVRLPLKLFSFTPEERETFGRSLGSFFSMPVRVEEKF